MMPPFSLASKSSNAHGYSEIEAAVIRSAANVFTLDSTDFNVNLSKIEHFLAATNELSFTRAERIMLLTMDKDFNWKATCHLYQYIEDHEPPAQAFAPLNMWIVNGLNYFILEKSGLTLKDRISIAEDIQKILARMLNKFPNDAGKANSMGSLFLNYPGRLEADEARLENALNWFRKAKQWSNTDDTAAEALLGAGEALFELGRWSEMFQTYQELRGMELCFEDSTANMIESRISDCYKNLST